MSDKLLIGNLSLNVNESVLEEIFSRAGSVRTVRLVTDSSGRNKGFAFVQMSQSDSALKAIKLFDGLEIDGRCIIVNQTRAEKPSPSFLERFRQLFRLGAQKE